jgi:thiamine transport system permease protein
LILFVGWLLGMLVSFSVEFEPAVADILLEAFFTTAALAILVGVLHMILLLAVAYVLPHGGLSRFLNGYLAPSPVITGFAILLLPGESETVALIKSAGALTLISFPLLYRWLAHSTLESLQKQVTVARTLGADWAAILTEIVWPQAAPQMMRVCGLAALWASGDFAISGILAGELKTVPLVMEGLMGNYRIEAAQTLMFPLLFMGLALYGAFTGAARYISR